LYRGVDVDLHDTYTVGRRIIWWGVSSCTSELKVAQRFLGPSGPRTLFEVSTSSAVSVGGLSAFQGEDEFIIGPGTFFRVTSVYKAKGGLVTIRLRELEEPAAVS
jgi:hypothetical protein